MDGITEDMAFSSIEEAFRKLAAENMALRGKKESLIREIESLEQHNAEGEHLIRELEADVEELELIRNEDFHIQRELETELAANLQKLQVCISVLEDLQMETGAMQNVAFEAAEWQQQSQEIKDTIEELARQLTEAQTEQEKAKKALQEQEEATKAMEKAIEQAEIDQKDVKAEMEASISQIVAECEELQAQICVETENETLLESSCRKAEDELKTLEAAVSEYEMRCKSLETLCDSLDADKSKLAAEIETLERHHQELQTELTEEQIKFQSSEVALKKKTELHTIAETNLSTRKEKYAGELEDMKREEQQLTEKLNKVKEKAESDRRAEAELTQQNEALTSGMKQLEEECRQLKQDIEYCTVEFAKSLEILNGLTEEVVKAEAEASKGASSILQLSEELTGKEEDLVALKAKLSSVEAANGELEAKFAQLEPELQDKKVIYSEKSNFVTTLEKQISEAAAKKEETTAETNALQKEAQDRMLAKNAHVEILRGDLAQLKNSIDAVRAAEQKMTEDLSAKDHQITELEKEFSDAEKSLQTQLANRDSERKASLERLNSTKLVLQHDVACKSAELMFLNEELESLRQRQAEQLKNLEKAHQEKMKEKQLIIDELKFHLEDAQIKLQKAGEENAKLQEEHNKLQKKLEEIYAEKSAFKLAIENLEAQITFIGCKLEELQLYLEAELAEQAKKVQDEAMRRQNRIQELKGQLQQAEMKAQTVKNQIQLEKKSASRTKGQLDATIASGNSLQAKVKKLKAKQDKTVKQLTTNGETRAALREETDRLSESVENMTDDMNKLRRSVESKRANKRALEANTNDQTQVCAMKRQEILQLKELITSEKDRLKVLLTERKKLLEDRDFFRKLQRDHLAGGSKSMPAPSAKKSSFAKATYLPSYSRISGRPALPSPIHPPRRRLEFPSFSSDSSPEMPPPSSSKRSKMSAPSSRSTATKTAKGKTGDKKGNGRRPGKR